MFKNLFEIDNAIVLYLETLYPSWTVIPEGEDLSIVYHDGTLENSQPNYVPVTLRSRNIFLMGETKTSSITSSLDTTLSFPQILVSPLDIKLLEDTYPRTDLLYTVDNDTVVVDAPTQRISMSYQVEGLSDNLIDHRILEQYITYHTFPRKLIQEYITLFDQTYTIYSDPVVSKSEELTNQYRVIKVFRLELDIKTQDPEVLPRVSSVTINVNLT